MRPEIELGPGGHIDPGVVVGYPPGRAVERRLTVGAEHHLRTGTVLYLGSSFGDRLQTGHHVVVREEVRAGDEVSIWSGSVIDYGVVIGDGVKVHTNCYVAQHSELGDGCFLAPGVSFANDLYPGDEESAALMRGPVIGPGAQLGVNVTVLPYVRIGAGTIIGAGSVVSRDLPDGVIAYGNPATVRKRVDERVPVAERAAQHRVSRG
jgi:acetyltransferase-like isoleucine patch superfamily enzyme